MPYWEDDFGVPEKTKPEDNVKKPTHEEIFNETGIMIHPERSGTHQLTTGSRQHLGSIKKYYGKWMFIPSNNIDAYGQDDMINIGHTLEFMNGDRKLGE